jgi:hypothetical protein
MRIDPPIPSRCEDSIRKWNRGLFQSMVQQIISHVSPFLFIWYSLNFRVFRNSVLSDFRLGPEIFLCVAELHSGLELVFSAP